MTEYNKKVVKFGTINRHDMPVERFIFNDKVNPLDFEGVQKDVEGFLLQNLKYTEVTVHPASWDGDIRSSALMLDCDVEIYITGLTMVSIAVIDTIRKMFWFHDKKVNVMHFYIDTGTYKPQTLTSWNGHAPIAIT